MQQIDSLYQFDPKDWATYEAARVQADATIRAAEIGAQAAINAADLQLDAAIIAAVAALFAGCMAYLAAIRAAKHQTQLEKHKLNNKICAYAIRQEILASNLMDNVKKMIKTIDDRIESIKNHNEHQLIDEKMTLMVEFKELPDQWKDEHWETHEILGEKFIRALIEVNEKHDQLNKEKENLIRKSTNKGRNARKIFPNLYQFYDLECNLYPYDGVFSEYKKSLSNFENSLSDLLKIISSRKSIDD